MRLIITRFKNIHDATIGRFDLKEGNINLLSGYTLEPAGKDTIIPNQDRRIPIGKYYVSWHNSSKFSRTLPLIYNEIVPKNRYILIHAGNYPKDTEGCILLGNKYDLKGIYKSVETLNKFLNYTSKRSFEVLIKEDYEN